MLPFMKTLPGKVALWAAVAALASTSIVFGHSANEPAPRTDQSWQARQKLLNERAAEAGEKAKVIFLGDSITQGWEGAGKEVWEQYYSSRNAVNLGIGGDRTQHVLWRLDHGNIDGLKPKAAVIMIGTNNSNGEDNTPGQIVDGVTAIVRKLQEKLPDTRILLVAIFPRNENYSPQRGKILQINQVLRKLADDKRVFWIDFGHEFVTSEGLIPADLMPDYLHLTKRGYELWAQAIEPQLAKVLGEDPIGSASASVARLAGEWLCSMRGNDGQNFETRLILQADNGKLTGKLARSEDRWLPIENAQVKGNEVSWIIKRDRPDGSVLTYYISGKVSGDAIQGTAKARLDGEERTAEWTARRK